MKSTEVHLPPTFPKHFRSLPEFAQLAWFGQIYDFEIENACLVVLRNGYCAEIIANASTDKRVLEVWHPDRPDYRHGIPWDEE